MLSIEQIAGYFPGELFQRNPQGALVEYLQYEFLDSLFKNADAVNLCFIGGTAIRILHQSVRFSEDLDFDNFGLSFAKFESLVLTACRDMEYKGFIIEYRVVNKSTFHCHIRFPGILFHAGITPDKKRKILIRIDTEAKEKLYDSERVVLNKFAVYRRILAAPPSILLAQKMITVLLRKREKGRDLFDVSFLRGLAQPDYGYIEKVTGLGEQEFRRQFDARVRELDLEFLAKDVEPFLFSPDQRDRILHFHE